MPRIRLDMSGISKRRVSRFCASFGKCEHSPAGQGEIDDKVKAFLARPIEGDWPYLWIDATCPKVRRGRRIVSVALTIAVGVNTGGRRAVLRLETGTSQAEPIWAQFPRRLTRPRRLDWTLHGKICTKGQDIDSKFCASELWLSRCACAELPAASDVPVRASSVVREPGDRRPPDQRQIPTRCETTMKQSIPPTEPGRKAVAGSAGDEALPCCRGREQVRSAANAGHSGETFRHDHSNVRPCKKVTSLFPRKQLASGSSYTNRNHGTPLAKIEKT